MLNDKIKKELSARAYPNPSKEAKILAYLNEYNNEVILLSDIQDATNTSGQIYQAAYHLASLGKIGFADRKYHNFASCEQTKRLSKKNRCIIWHIDHNVNIAIKPQFASYQKATTQPSLFGDNLADLSNDELSKLITRAKSIQMQRDVDQRYAGGMAHIVDPIKEALKGYGVADPVALVHAGQDVTFATMTETKAMPIKITIQQKGMPVVQTINCTTLTLHGVPLIATLQQAYINAQNGAK